MNRATRIVLITAAAAVVLLAILLTSPKHPIALIQVVDGAGRRIQGAVIRPDGLRPKPGPYGSGHYGWFSERVGVVNDPVFTDKDGLARVPYPKYVFERIETGEISFSVDHPDFVPDRPFRIVSARPPAGAPWHVWAAYLWARVQHKELISRTDPVVVQPGAPLRISVQPGSPGPRETPLLAQVSGHWLPGSNFWNSPNPGIIQTHRLSPGKQAVRAVRFDQDGVAWFSEVVDVTVGVSQTNELAVHLVPGAKVRGQLDSTVTRPVRNGRVVIHVWPPGYKPEESAPQWHAWAPVAADGSFELGALPPGDLELVALSDGFVSTNGPGQFKMRYPQKHVLGTNDLTITIGMEPTARLEVRVSDERGAPIQGAHVAAWPNVRYGEWAATVLLSDCYNVSDLFLAKPGAQKPGWGQPVADFEGIADSTGLAVLANLPCDVTEFAVEHAKYVLPAVSTPGGDKRRQASITLVGGTTNRISVTVVPRDRAPIRHY
jgi:hypothetical protein